jgi:HTH-type transcriptional regulator/antitoxin MqsA
LEDAETEKHMKSCPVCKSEALAERTIRTTLDYGGRIYIVENVPAKICDECGEVLLRPDTAKALERLVREGKPPHHAESVPVYDLSAAA